MTPNASFPLRYFYSKTRVFLVIENIVIRFKFIEQITSHLYQ